MNDLRGIGLDGDVLTSVDAYLRNSWQPRVTRLEQSISDLRPAQALFADLQADPIGTYLAITEEMYGSETADQIQAMLEAGVTPADGPSDDTGPAPLDPRVERVVTQFEADESAAAYQAEKTQFLSQDENKDIDGKLLDPFVAAAEGDWNLAAQAYRAFRDSWAETHGSSEEQPPADPPPAVIGAEAASTTAPPVQHKYPSFDAALDAFFDEQRASAPPTVGAV